MHITQPAVTQHIKALESAYKVELFQYKNKNLSLTKEGQILYDFATAMKTSSDKVKNKLLKSSEGNISLRFGATLTIGEYTMAPLVKKLLKNYPGINLNMKVSNTQNLLFSLQEGNIDFAILEGHFDKSKYGYIKFKEEDFIGICSPSHPFAHKKIDFNDILLENLILRENGSGTRDIFEKVLHEFNFTLESLKNFIEIGNMKIIKSLVSDNFGISFLYKESVKDEIKEGKIKEIHIQNFNIKREFNFVYLKESLHAEEYKSWFDFFLSQLES